MRDMVMFLAMLGMVPMAIMNGFVAFLFWGYTTVLTPAHYLYGFMLGVRFNFIFAAVALGLLFLGKTGTKGTKLKLSATYWLLLAFFIHASLSTLFALRPNPMLAIRYEDFVKGFAFTLAIPFFVRDRAGIHALLVMLALGLGLHGVVEGLKFIASGGGHRMNGIGNSSLTDNNLFAVGMVIVLPILLYFSTVFNNKYSKIAAIIGALLTILTIIATNSRGGFLALSVLGLWYFVGSRRKGLALLGVLAGVVIIFLAAPDSWFDRVSSIQTADEDLSFMNRVAAWKVSAALGLANPVFGAGFSAIQNFWIWEIYKDMPSFFSMDMSQYSTLVAHSVYFQVLGDMGFIGLFLFLALLASSYFNRRSITQKIKKFDRPDLIWARDMADAIFLSLLGYMVGGAGVSLTYYEVVYILICLMSVLHTVVDAQINNKLRTLA
ncbi:putative O-glycosylation ligase, exosortase A system-associated [Rhodoferax sp. BLA1]|uniref:putative O-glycosylation ligase, exosortase A system-associated n=1 Tax=Rhodoferax sp. BLA1 TaxID=2576062 RepID=UPI0015D2C828|nr:putative O-glycosylation ligase, exosortase A system-associated [Rhodoferax sp. BLA1]